MTSLITTSRYSVTMSSHAPDTPQRLTNGPWPNRLSLEFPSISARLSLRLQADLRKSRRPCQTPALPPPLTPPPRAGKSSPPDGLGSWPRKASTSPKPLSVLAFLTPSRVRFAGLRPPLTASSTPATSRLWIAEHLSWRRWPAASSTRNDIDPMFTHFRNRLKHVAIMLNSSPCHPSFG